jgi:hypothetical protein
MKRMMVVLMEDGLGGGDRYMAWRGRAGIFQQDDVIGA